MEAKRQKQVELIDDSDGNLGHNLGDNLGISSLLSILRIRNAACVCML